MKYIARPIDYSACCESADQNIARFKRVAAALERRCRDVEDVLFVAGVYLPGLGGLLGVYYAGEEAPRNIPDMMGLLPVFCEKITFTKSIPVHEETLTLQ